MDPALLHVGKRPVETPDDQPQTEAARKIAQGIVDELEFLGHGNDGVEHPPGERSDHDQQHDDQDAARSADQG